jgi:hypothetical protein
MRKIPSMLDSFSRAAIVGLIALSVAGAVALAPVRAHDSTMHAPPSRIVAAAQAPAPVAVAIARDPFAEPAAAPAPATQAAAQPIAGHGPIGPLPSNLSTDVIPAVPGTAAESSGTSPRITAVVTGAHPYALVETDGVHEIKGIGDRIGGSPVTAIDLDGIRLQNGERFAIARGAQL